MMLTPTETERLTIFTAAELARRNLSRGIKLSAPEAVAYICDELMLGARQGRSLAELMEYGGTLLTTDAVLPGVDKLMPMIQVEAMFPDGTKMITVHEPISPGKEDAPPDTETRPGELITLDGEIELNAGRRRAAVVVKNTGDRSVQVGSEHRYLHCPASNRR